MKKIFFVLFFGLGLRLVHLDQSLWLDEAAQAIESAGSFSGLFQIYADFMPPLFHILLYFWMKISHQEAWMRLLSISFGVGTIYFTYLITRRLFSEPVAILSAFLLSISPFHIYYSQELRPYTAATFFGLWSTYLLLQNHWLLYTSVATLFIYSLYTAPFLIAAHGFLVYIYMRKHFKHWLTAMFVVVAAFLPWLPTFSRQLSGGTMLGRLLPGWSEAVSSPPVKAAFLTLAKFMLGRVTIDNKIIYGAVFGLLVALVTYFFWQAWQKNKYQTSKLLLLVSIPIVSVFIISFFIPIFAPQRLLFILPFFLVAMAVGIREIKGIRGGIAMIFFLLPQFYGLVLYYTNPRFQREQWRQATAFVEERADVKTGVIFGFSEPFAPYLWYMTKDKGLGAAKRFVVSENDLMHLYGYVEDKDKVFFFQYLTDLTDPEKKIPAFLVNRGFALSQTHDFPGVGFIYEYQRNY